MAPRGFIEALGSFIDALLSHIAALLSIRVAVGNSIDALFSHVAALLSNKVAVGNRFAIGYEISEFDFKASDLGNKSREFDANEL